MGALGVIVGLMVIGYVQPEVSGEYLPQTQFVKDGMFALATLIPAIGFALSLIPMLFYDYTGKRKEKILAELEEKRAARAAELSSASDTAEEAEPALTESVFVKESAVQTATTPRETESGDTPEQGE